MAHIDVRHEKALLKLINTIINSDIHVDKVSYRRAVEQGIDISKLESEMCKVYVIEDDFSLVHYKQFK